MTRYKRLFCLLTALLLVLIHAWGLDSALAQTEVSSDVDRYISGLQALRPNPQRWAVIIGIEKYQQTYAAQFARRDAQSFKEYSRKLLEIPEENIFFLLDEEATKTRLQVLFEERLPRRLRPGDQLFVYYAGHGLADPRTGQPYFLPSDADPQSIQRSAYSAEDFYGALGRLKSHVFVFLDSCFSGIAGRQERTQPLLLAARPLTLTVEDPAIKHKNVTVLAAAQHDQLSNADTRNGHGLFTYYLLRGLVGEADSDRNGRVRLGELASYVKDSVDRMARRLYGQTRDQTPVLTPANLDARQDIELTSRIGKLLAPEQPPVATPRPPVQEPPVIARPRSPSEEPTSPPARLNANVANLPLIPVEKQFIATSQVKAREAPSVVATALVTLEIGNAVEVLARVKDQDWYLVARSGVPVGFAPTANFVEAEKWFRTGVRLVIRNPSGLKLQWAGCRIGDVEPISEAEDEQRYFTYPLSPGPASDPGRDGRWLTSSMHNDWLLPDGLVLCEEYIPGAGKHGLGLSFDHIPNPHLPDTNPKRFEWAHNQQPIIYFETRVGVRTVITTRLTLSTVKGRKVFRAVIENVAFSP